jgi:hypothetical protein
LRKAFRE